MTIKRYIDQIKTELREDHDESKLNDRLIERWIDSQRALWIKNKAFKGALVQNKAIQTLKHLEMTPSPEEFRMDSGSSDKYLTSVKQVPSVIEVKGSPLIFSCRVSGLSGRDINILSMNEAKYAGNGRLNGGDLFGFIYNKRLFIKVPKNDSRAALITHVDMDAVFETPRELSVHTYPGGVSYDIEVEEYPLSDTDWDYISGQIKANNFRLFKSLPDNKENDQAENN